MSPPLSRRQSKRTQFARVRQILRRGSIVSVTEPITIRGMVVPARLGARRRRAHRDRRNLRSVTAQTATPAPGIPLDVATRRAAIVSDLRYELTLTIPREQQAPITGTMTARFDAGRRVAAAGPRLRARRGQREERAGERRGGDRGVSAGPHRAAGRGAEGRASPRSTSSSPPATPRSTAIRISSTRCSCRRARTWPSRCSTSPT